ncbi:MAG: glycosyltransferase, partial [Porticoccaceae bacterium]
AVSHQPLESHQPEGGLAQVSVIIPLAPNETQHKQLLADLQSHRQLQAEIIPCSNQSRAKSLNSGAAQASGEWLWFVHADSRISADNLCALKQSLEQYPDALHYFDLAFDWRFLRCNAMGANLRSRLLGIPFGDQGFCIKKSRFNDLGGYCEETAYGEDLLFVWQAHQAGIKLQRIPSKLLTSGRKYQQQGWLKLSLLYQWRWILMSLPQLLKLIAIRIRALYD